MRLAKIQARGKSAAARARLSARLLDGWAPAADAQLISRTLAGRIHHARMQVLRCHRFGTWKPAVKLIGGEHVERALSAGKGAVLWVAPFVYSDLMTKVACHQRGLLTTHLSRRDHPISGTRLGTKLLNPIWTSIERRYIAERVVMAPGQTAAALRELVRRVRANQLISITAVAASGQKTYSARFLNGKLRVAGGAPSLAQRSGAALLPVFTILDAEGAFVTTIHPSIRAPDGLDADAAMQHVVAQWRRGWKPTFSIGRTNTPGNWFHWNKPTFANAGILQERNRPPGEGRVVRRFERVLDLAKNRVLRGSHFDENGFLLPQE